ncbi:MAG: Skp family chaperone for outer membrane protein [Paracoccaceae bacterium]|jgi:Skp family chaperone for outer membrane proteins
MRNKLHQARIAWFVVAILFAGVLALPVSAQQSAQRIFSINQDRLYGLSEFGLRVLDVFTRQSEDISAENGRITTELKEEEQALTDKRAGLSHADFRVLADAFDAKVEDIRTEQAKKSNDLSAFSETEQRRFFDLVFPVLLVLAEELSATAILDERLIIITSEQMDITAVAVQRVNVAIGDGTQTTDP